MYIAYIATTILTALATGYAALLDFSGAESVKVIADRIHVSRKMMVPFGVLLAAGSAGLLIGFAVEQVGIAAAFCLVLYFVCAIGAHLRAGDTGIGGAVFFLVLAACALGTSLRYHD